MMANATKALEWHYLMIINHRRLLYLWGTKVAKVWLTLRSASIPSIPIELKNYFSLGYKKKSSTQVNAAAQSVDIRCIACYYVKGVEVQFWK